jgi:hypothetical protein
MLTGRLSGRRRVTPAPSAIAVFTGVVLFAPLWYRLRGSAPRVEARLASSSGLRRRRRTRSFHFYGRGRLCGDGFAVGVSECGKQVIRYQTHCVSLP